MRYRRLPLEVDARQFTGFLDDDLEAWLGKAHGSWRPAQNGQPAMLEVLIAPGQACTAMTGDWIVKGDAGVYVCPGNLFERTHEAVEA